MSISEQNPPRDTDGETLSPLDITRRVLAERMPQILKTEKMRSKHKQHRTLELARQMHTCGAASLPLPNFAAFTEIQRIETNDDNPYKFVAECLFILANQCDEDKLFLAGPARHKAILAATKNVHAHNVSDYLLCIREMLDEIKKKQHFSIAATQKEMVNLMQQISSSLSVKPSDSQPVTS